MQMRNITIAITDVGSGGITTIIVTVPANTSG
jgi:hypothetical protein